MFGCSKPLLLGAAVVIGYGPMAQAAYTVTLAQVGEQRRRHRRRIASTWPG